MSEFDASGSIRAKKSLGQNFLKDSHFFNEWIDQAAKQLPPYDFALEIGPGKGALTFLIQGKFKRFICVEKDHRLIEILRNELQKNEGRVDLIEADFMQWNLPHFLSELEPEKFSNGIVFANLPYYVASQIMMSLLEELPIIKKGYLMFQQEMAQRIVAPHGNKAFGALSLLCQYLSSAKIVKDLKPDDFIPAPKVHSSVVEFTRHPSRCADAEYFWFKKIVKTGFQFRRKTMRNNFKNFFKTEYPHLNAQSLNNIENWIDWTRRPEDVSLDEWIQLSSQLKNPI